jgi:hypothetical protein
MTVEAAAQPGSPRRSRVLRLIARRLDRVAERFENGRATQKPSGASQAFWPYGTQAAIWCVVALWVVLGAFAYLANRYVGWPSQSSENHVFYVATVIGLLPLALVVLDVVARGGGAVDLRGFKIDFSRSKVQSDVQVAADLGHPGRVLSDTSASNILEALRTSVDHDAIRIDLHDTWWLTRLFALSAGAHRAGSPRAFVIVRTDDDGRQAFVGWTQPVAVLNALLAMRPDKFAKPYAEAQAIAQQLAAFGPAETRPMPPPAWPFIVNKYLGNDQYNQLGLAALEHVLLDLLAPLEEDPEKLDFAELRKQLGDALVTDKIELTATAADQIRTLLQSSASFIALVRSGEYKTIVGRDDAERDILRQLAQPSSLAD